MVTGHDRVRAELEAVLPYPAVLLFGPAHTGKYTLACYLAAHHAHPADKIEFPRLTVDAARLASGFLRLVPRGGQVKVIAISLDGATGAAQHALLKALEEPPPYGRFVLAASTTVLPTVASRCVIRRTGFLSDAESAEVITAGGVSRDQAVRLAAAARGAPGEVMAGWDLGKARQSVSGLADAAARGDVVAVDRVLRSWDAAEDWLMRRMLAAAACGRPDPLFSVQARPGRRAARRAIARLSRVPDARPHLAARIVAAALEEGTGHG